jgi:tRNA threonylcarbamoyladenosine biosynthesis protein TsaB
MQVDSSQQFQARPFALGIDTCGPTGSVSLARINERESETLGQIELEGRTYSATLFTAIEELLKRSGITLKNIGCIVAVSGPGSFTGVRIGLSAAKGLSEGADIPVVAVSRLEILALKAGVASAALDAHRHEVFLRIQTASLPALELLAGAAEFASILPPPSQIAVCDDAAAALLASAWPQAELIRVLPPTAADAIELAVPRIRAAEFADIALLDGHYLRRSDAEIFGEPTPAAVHPT